MERNRENIFDSYLSDQRLYVDRIPLTDRYQPSHVMHRDQQAKEMAGILAPILRDRSTVYGFLGGSNGSGKTSLTTQVIEDMGLKAETLDRDIVICMFDCAFVNTEYRLLTNITNQMIEDWQNRLPFTGLPTIRVLDRLNHVMTQRDCDVLVVLDNMDSLGKHLESTLSTLIWSTNCSVLGIFNNIGILDVLPAKLRAYTHLRVLFPSYTKRELEQLLEERADEALADGVLGDGVIPYCAQVGAEESGDARQTIQLLREAVDLAQQNGDEYVMLHHAKDARTKGILNYHKYLVQSLPVHQKILLSCLCQNGEEPMTSGVLYKRYKIEADDRNEIPLTSRRIYDLTDQLGVLGILHTEVLSKGKGGRTRKIELTWDGRLIDHWLKNGNGKVVN